MAQFTFAINACGIDVKCAQHKNDRWKITAQSKRTKKRRELARSASTDELKRLCSVIINGIHAKFTRDFTQNADLLKQAYRRIHEKSKNPVSSGDIEPKVEGITHFNNSSHV